MALPLPRACSALLCLARLRASSFVPSCFSVSVLLFRFLVQVAPCSAARLPGFRPQYSKDVFRLTLSCFCCFRLPSPLTPTTVAACMCRFPCSSCFRVSSSCVPPSQLQVISVPCRTHQVFPASLISSSSLTSSSTSLPDVPCLFKAQVQVQFRSQLRISPPSSSSAPRQFQFRCVPSSCRP